MFININEKFVCLSKLNDKSVDYLPKHFVSLLSIALERLKGYQMIGIQIVWLYVL